MNYKPLAESFKKNGFNHELIIREGDVAIYERSKNGKNFHYEVIIIKRHNGYMLAGILIEPAEIYPSSSLWGANGFTYNTLEEAENKFNSLK
jgi:hypothetical protein